MRSMAQNNIIIGNVTSVNGEVVPGVSIQIKGINSIAMLVLNKLIVTPITNLNTEKAEQILIILI